MKDAHRKACEAEAVLIANERARKTPCNFGGCGEHAEPCNRENHWQYEYERALDDILSEEEPMS